MLPQKDNQPASDVLRQDWHRYCSRYAPNDECMPLPLPDLVEQPKGVMAQVLELSTIHGQLAGVKQVHAKLNKGDEEQQV